MEHLLDPIGFLRSIREPDSKYFVLTVPFVSLSKTHSLGLIEPDEHRRSWEARVHRGIEARLSVLDDGLFQRDSELEVPRGLGVGERGDHRGEPGDPRFL